MLSEHFGQSTPAWSSRRIRVRPMAWVPGEVLVGVNVQIPPGADPLPSVSVVRQQIARLLGEQLPTEPPSPEEPVLEVPAEKEDERLLLLPVKLTRSEPAATRLAIGRINQAAGRELANNIQLVAATPNWFGAAQDCCGGSPASQPLPVEPFGDRIRYAPELPALDLLGEAEKSIRGGPAPVQIAVLDTAPELSEIHAALEQFKDNRHLREVIERLIPPIGGLPPSPLEQARIGTLQTLERNGGIRPIEPAHPFDISDHGLFVASIAYAVAPWAPLQLVRVLNNFGVGSLHSLTVGLLGLLKAKGASDRLIINLSLGILPALEQLASIWFGLPVAGLPGCPEDPSLQFIVRQGSDVQEPVPAAKLRELIDDGDATIKDSLDLVQAPVRRLMELLLAQNCLIVAAAGNDSMFRGVERNPRWSPRIPALYDTTLGVAATSVHATQPARYSNQGETPSELARDAVSTLGGDVDVDGITPQSGVIGIYAAERFPPLLPPAEPLVNRSGWAQWSGTSFATPLMAGIAANTWATQTGSNARQILDRLNAESRAGGRPESPELGVVNVPVSLTWFP
ncbi:MAG: S8/S53 family peptidase [Chloroflexi bacterium]|nr:S8/S53 family peptidase [Chloroflexota bacterium]